MIVLYLKILVTSAQEALKATAFGQTAAGWSEIGVAPNALTGQWADGARSKMFVFPQNPWNGAMR
jgi:hypothetical protein